MQKNSSVRVLPISAYDDNYIWLATDGRACFVVDPGDAQPVIAYLKEQRLLLKTILITHHHADHVGGVAELVSWVQEHQQLTPIVYGPAHEEIDCVAAGLIEGDSLHIQDPPCDLMVLDVPGHTAGHVAFHVQTSDAHHLFCGDTLFACGCGRIFEGTAEQMYTSLAKLKNLPGDTWVHCAHEYTLSNIRFALAVEPSNQDLQDWAVRAKALRASGKPTLPTTIAHEKKVNPFFRSDIHGVMTGVLSHRPQTPKTPLEIFAATRAWKDAFK